MSSEGRLKEDMEGSGALAERSNALELTRVRLRLALIGVGIVPPLIITALLYSISPRAVPIELMTLFALVALLALPVILWLPARVLRPTENLEQSRIEIRRLYEVARADSLRDALSGLGNHRAFQEELDRQIESYDRYRVPVALLLIDLDNLKLVNDSRGHAGGDELLREMGRLIASSTRFADRSFRVGGDEFAILMPHTTESGALDFARRLQHHALERGGSQPAISFSGGISACPSLTTTRAQLYAQADAAMYWCKRHGRASVDVFNPERDHAASLQANAETSAAIARVIGERLVQPVYQPIVDLVSGAVVGFEGLSRPSPDSGFADPASMFAAAESAGRTVELDLACLHAVVAGARAMPPDQLLSLNLSPRTLEAPHFSADALLSILGRYGIAPGRVVVELTEREVVEDTSRVQATLASLQRVGVRIAADDVGSGNAGLRLLSQMRFDMVKIDLTLVQQGTHSDSSHAILRSLTDLAGRWGAAVIAEGIETVGQLRMVRQLGLTGGQGYLLGRPMPSPVLATVDLAAIESGTLILARRPGSQPVAPPTAGWPQATSPIN
jgi:diguanylate cyclase (GGDEF)-like protein